MKKLNKNKILIIIPAYNEEMNIINTYNKIRSLKIQNIIIDYLIINDGSIDNTKNILLKEHLNFIDLVNNLGIGGAMQTGYKYAYIHNYDYAIQFDGDGQHNEKYIEKLLNHINQTGCDFGIGSRFVGNLSTFKSTKTRRIGINFLSWLIKCGTGKKILDVTSGFRIANKEVIKLFATDYPDDYPEPETIVFLLRNGYKIDEIPVEMNEREYGSSSINKFKSIYYMVKVSFALIISLFNYRREKK